MPIDDPELLRRYAETGAEDAFAELVRRRIGLVYSVALRHTRDAHRAEDVTQAVFTALARKAGELSRRPVLLGWLYRSAQFAASDAVRVAVRRQAREQEAHIMQQITRESPDPDWDKLRPVLDEVLNGMDERDRDAVLLRFFDNQPFAEIGARLRLSENAARMRVERALEKMHAALARRGVTSTAAALGAALAIPAGAAVPAGLAVTVTGAAMVGAVSAAGAGGTAAGWLAFMSMNKLQLGITSALAVAGATGYVVQGQTNTALRQEIVALQAPLREVVTLRVENRRLAVAAAEVEELRRDDVELKQLEGRVTELKRAGEARAKVAQAQARTDRRGALQEVVRDVSQRAQQEIDRLNKEGNALVAEYKALDGRAKDPLLNDAQRIEMDSAKKAKLVEIKAKQEEVKAVYARERGEIRVRAQEIIQTTPPSPGQSTENSWSFRPTGSRFELRADPGTASVPGKIEVLEVPKPDAPRP